MCFAWLVDGKYVISINGTFDQSINTVMARVVKSPDVLPWLAAQSPERAKGAKLLSRLCMDFILAHEHGHIIGGHVDLLNFETADADGLVEFNAISRDDHDTSYIERSQAWEFEADTIGASLLDREIDDLIIAVQSQKIDDGTKTFLGDPAIAVEHIGALAIASLYVLFRLMRKTKDELILVGHHPDPLIRAFTCRDVIAHRLGHRHNFDQDRFRKMMHYHLETFDWALEDMGYTVPQMENDDGVDQVNAALGDLVKLQSKYHHTTKDTRLAEWFTSQI
ncbi:hypothetical protein [Sulfitobacter sp.]|uniref:hypothetical protein n=1 Tax=Sulfitobacter sp. TaxID=1903071 RepID=UPI0030035150